MLCQEGYTGLLCSTCSPGWGRIRHADCTRCLEQKSVNRLAYALIVVVNVVTLCITIRSTINKDNASGGRPLRALPYFSQIIKVREKVSLPPHPSFTGPKRLVYFALGSRAVASDERTTSPQCHSLQVFVNYAMVVSMAARLPVKWPRSIRGLFKALDAVAQSQEVFSLDCTLQMETPLIYVKAASFLAAIFVRERIAHSYPCFASPQTGGSPGLSLLLNPPFSRNTTVVPTASCRFCRSWSHPYFGGPGTCECVRPNSAKFLVLLPARNHFSQSREGFGGRCGIRSRFFVPPVFLGFAGAPEARRLVCDCGLPQE